MSSCRRQAQLEAPAEEIWELVGNPVRYPERWPRLIEVQGERFDTFVDVEIGMEPEGRSNHLFEAA